MISIAALLAWAYLLTLHGRFWQAGPILPGVLAPLRPNASPPLAFPPGAFPAVAIVVAARDEAALIARSIASLLTQDYSGPFRVVLVDDNSRDATAAIARALPQGAKSGDKLTVIDGAPCPAGWAGKLWALHQGVAATGAELILLTDADIEHDPAHLATLVAKAEASGVDMVSEMVALNCTSLAERALVPAFVYLFQLLYPFAWVNDPLRATSAAAGGTVLIRRAALDRIGGIAAIADRLIDDCALAAKVKQGGRIWLGHSTLARSIRPYPELADIWRMVARSAYVQLRFSPVLLLGTMVGLALIFLAPPAFALFGTQSDRAAGLLAWAGMALSFVPTLRRFGRSLVWAPLLPAIAAFYMAATVAAAIAHHRGRGVVWKSRVYTAGKA